MAQEKRETNKKTKQQMEKQIAKIKDADSLKLYKKEVKKFGLEAQYQAKLAELGVPIEEIQKDGEKGKEKVEKKGKKTDKIDSINKGALDEAAQVREKFKKEGGSLLPAAIPGEKINHHENESEEEAKAIIEKAKGDKKKAVTEEKEQKEKPKSRFESPIFAPGMSADALAIKDRHEKEYQKTGTIAAEKDRIEKEQQEKEQQERDRLEAEKKERERIENEEQEKIRREEEERQRDEDLEKWGIENDPDNKYQKAKDAYAAEYKNLLEEREAESGWLKKKWRKIYGSKIEADDVENNVKRVAFIDAQHAYNQALAGLTQKMLDQKHTELVDANMDPDDIDQELWMYRKGVITDFVREKQKELRDNNTEQLPATQAGMVRKALDKYSKWAVENPKKAKAAAMVIAAGSATAIGVFMGTIGTGGTLAYGASKLATNAIISGALLARNSKWIASEKLNLKDRWGIDLRHGVQADLKRVEEKYQKKMKKLAGYELTPHVMAEMQELEIEREQGEKNARLKNIAIDTALRLTTNWGLSHYGAFHSVGKGLFGDADYLKASIADQNAIGQKMLGGISHFWNEHKPWGAHEGSAETANHPEKNSGGAAEHKDQAAQNQEKPAAQESSSQKEAAAQESQKETSSAKESATQEAPKETSSAKPAAQESQATPATKTVPGNSNASGKITEDPTQKATAPAGKTSAPANNNTAAPKTGNAAPATTGNTAPAGHTEANVTTEGKISEDAVIKKGEGVSYAFKRQLEHNPEIAKATGYDQATTAAEKHDILVKLLHDRGYMSDDGSEVRVNLGQGAAYELKLDDNGTVVANEYHNGVLVESHSPNASFEGNDIENKSDHNYEYLKDNNSSPTHGVGTPPDKGSFGPTNSAPGTGVGTKPETGSFGPHTGGDVTAEHPFGTHTALDNTREYFKSLSDKHEIGAPKPIVENHPDVASDDKYYSPENDTTGGTHGQEGVPPEEFKHDHHHGGHHHGERAEHRRSGVPGKFYQWMNYYSPGYNPPVIPGEVWQGDASRMFQNPSSFFVDHAMDPHYNFYRSVYQMARETTVPPNSGEAYHDYLVRIGRIQG